MSSSILSDAASPSPQMWAFYAMAIMTLLYVVFVRPMQRQKKDPLSRTPGETRGGLAKQRAVERQMETLIVELSEMARQITGQLDTRAAKLEALLRESDEKIARLTALASANGKPAENNGKQSRLAEEAIPIGVPQDDPRHREIYDLADAGQSPAAIAQRLSRPGGEVELILALRPRK